MRVSLIQMDMLFSSPKENYKKAEELVYRAYKENQPDTIVLPETWNTGFFPHENLESLADDNGKETISLFSRLSKELSVNIIAGSVANKKDDGIYNTAYVFDRNGKVVTSYDKTHLFSPMGEDDYFMKGDKPCSFTLDEVKCGLIICYDIRFPELTRTIALNGLDILFVVSEWPDKRIPHLNALAAARAIENQAYVCVCNSIGKTEDTQYGGSSAIYGPLGEELVHAGCEKEEIISSLCDTTVIKNIRSSINVFRDRRPELYRI